MTRLYPDDIPWWPITGEEFCKIRDDNDIGISVGFRDRPKWMAHPHIATGVFIIARTITGFYSNEDTYYINVDIIPWETYKTANADYLSGPNRLWAVDQ